MTLPSVSSIIGQTVSDVKSVLLSSIVGGNFAGNVTYKPSGGDALVKSGRSTIYISPGDEAFYAAVDTYLIDATWVPQTTWKNTTAAAQTNTAQYTTGLTVTAGSDITAAVGIAAAYDGLSITMDASVKTFADYETTDSMEKVVMLDVPPLSTVTFYQRKYRFRDTMFFILDAWNAEWNAGSWGGYDITRKDCAVEIMSEDYLTTVIPLNGTTTGTMVVNTVSRAEQESARVTRTRESLTERAKEALDSIVV